MNFRLSALLACGMLSAACGVTIKTSVNDPSHPTNSAILLAERVEDTDNNRSYYLQAVPSVPTGSIDRSKSTELTSADVAVFDGWVFARDRTAKTVTRYSVDANLKLNVDGQVSFANTGLPGGRTYDAYLSATQAYALDRVNLKLIEWNPTSLELTGKTIDISSYGKANLDLSFGVPLNVGAKAYVQVSWTDEDNNIIYPKMAVMVIDGLGGVPPIIEDGRTGPGFALYSDAAGNIYAPGFISAAYVSFGRASNGANFPNDGVLKLGSGASAFDSSYFVDLTGIVQSPSTYAVWRLDDTHVLTQCIVPTGNHSSSWTKADDVYNSAEYVYMLVDTSSKTSTQVAAVPEGYAANSLPQVLDGEIYVQTYLISGGAVTGAQVAAVAGTTATAAFQVPAGDLWHLQRVR